MRRRSEAPPGRANDSDREQALLRREYHPVLVRGWLGGAPNEGGPQADVPERSQEAQREDEHGIKAELSRRKDSSKGNASGEVHGSDQDLAEAKRHCPSKHLPTNGLRGPFGDGLDIDAVERHLHGAARPRVNHGCRLLGTDGRRQLLGYSVARASRPVARRAHLVRNAPSPHLDSAESLRILA